MRGVLRRLIDRPLVGKLLRYSMTSAVGVVVGQGLLLILSGPLGWPGVAANLTAVAISSVPVYLIYRGWVWRKSGRNSLLTEVLPFWLMTLLGLVVSTAFVALADRRSDSPLVYVLASSAGFGVVWVAKFFVLDRFIFLPVDEAAGADDSALIR